MERTKDNFIPDKISKSSNENNNPNNKPVNLGLVSVIMPIYNIEKYLARSIQSILDQSYPFFELLLIDDGSSDNSPVICDEYALKDSRIKVIHKENQGVSATRNKGINESKGNYIVFVDSDDLIQKKMLENMITAINRYQTDLVICGYERFRDDWKQSQRLSPYSLVILQSRQELASVYKAPATNMFGISIWAKMYRADLIRKHNIRFREEITYEEDCIFNLDYFRHVSSTAVLNNYFYRYRQMDNSLSKGYRRDSFHFLVNGFRERQKFLKELKINTAGADTIFMLVVKTTLIKIFDSSLSKHEKMTEYLDVAEFDASQEVCANGLNSKNYLTRQLAKAVLAKNPRKIHNAIYLSRKIDKSKSIIKRFLGRGNK